MYRGHLIAIQQPLRRRLPLSLRPRETTSQVERTRPRTLDGSARCLVDTRSVARHAGFPVPRIAPSATASCIRTTRSDVRTSIAYLGLPPMAATRTPTAVADVYQGCGVLQVYCRVVRL